MPFPQTPLALRSLLALGANPASPSTWNFTEITSDVRTADGVTITAGRQDEGSQVDTTKAGATIDNRSGNYARTNPLSAHYGLLDRGTPIEHRVTLINDTFTRTTSNGLGTEPNSGLTWSHITPSQWATTGSAATVTISTANVFGTALLSGATGHDVDIRHTSSAPAVMTGAAWVDATMVRYVDGNNFYRLNTEFTTAGTIGVKISKVVAGAIVDLTSVLSTGVSYSAGTRICTRVRAVGAVLQIRCWLESGSEPTVWHAQVSDDDLNGTITGLYEWRVNGNTNAGSLTITVDDFRMDTIRSSTPVPEWTPGWGSTPADATVTTVGAGIFRQLAQGKAALRSPMYRHITGYTSRIGHWPLEDGSEATQLANTVAGGKPGILSGVSLASTDGPDGAASVARSSSTSTMSGRFAYADPSLGWQISWACKLAVAPTGTPTEIFRWTVVGGQTWSWQVSTAGFRLLVTSDLGTELDYAFGTGGYSATNWLSYRVKVYNLGSNTVEAAWFGEDGGVPAGITTSFGTALGYLTGWQQIGNSLVVDAMYSHVFAVSGTSDDLQSYNARRNFDGYAGETAFDRMARLCAQEGVPIAIIGTATGSTMMGRQTAAILLDLLRECEEADQGVLYERGAGLGYLDRRARYNQAATMALDFTSGHIAAPPEPVDNDQRLRNRIVLTRTGGSSVTVENATSIAKNGIYEDEVDANLDDDSDLTGHAYWRLHLGTQDGLRWPRIELNLARNPSLIASWCSVRIGSRITIANPPATVGAGPLDLIVEGWTETLGIYSWDVVLVCSPAEPWDVATYDDATVRYDSRSTTLKTTVAAGVTSLTFRTGSLLDVWSTSEVPYPVVISGERVTVTAMGAASLVSGAYDQAATVTRAVNGIAKSLPAGSEIHVAVTPRYAL